MTKILYSMAFLEANGSLAITDLLAIFGSDHLIFG